MGNGRSDDDGHDHRPTDDAHYLRRSFMRAVKASLCVSCWGGIFALLLMHGPPAMSVSSGATYPAGIVTGAFAIMLSTGAATVLTIILGVFVLATVGWHHNQTADTHDDTDTMEDESHA